MKKPAYSDEKMQAEIADIESMTRLDARKTTVPSDTVKDLKARARIFKNRLSAKRSRESKKVYVQQMEERVAELEAENARLRDTLVRRGVHLEEGPVESNSNFCEQGSTQESLSSSPSSPETNTTAWSPSPSPCGGHA